LTLLPGLKGGELLVVVDISRMPSGALESALKASTAHQSRIDRTATREARWSRAKTLTQGGETEAGGLCEKQRRHAGDMRVAMLVPWYVS